MPVSGKTDPKGDVYVFFRHINSRPVRHEPYTNAERPDTDFFYDEGIYDAYPDRKEHLERRRAVERRKTVAVQTWAFAAVDAMDAGDPLPPTRREILVEVFDLLYRIGPRGLTRAEICAMIHRDGGKVSGAMTDLHAAKIIYPLEGVRR